MNNELNRLIDQEALATHAKTFVYLFIIIYVFFVVMSTIFPLSVYSSLKHTKSHRVYLQSLHVVQLGHVFTETQIVGVKELTQMHLTCLR